MNAPSSLRAALSLLDEKKASQDDKLAACEALVDAGAEAIPLLVERLLAEHDPVFLEDLLVDTGPMNAGPTQNVTVSVKFQVEALLYCIVWPEDEAPPNADGKKDPLQALRPDPAELNLGDARPPLAFVNDWSNWWKTRFNNFCRGSIKSRFNRIW